MTEEKPPPNRLRQVRLLLWALVALALVGIAALLVLRRGETSQPQMRTISTQAGLGGPFTLTGGDGRPFSSQRLAGKPYAIFFGFTRCGDVCPTTLGRLAKLRREAGGEDAFAIVFATTDPAHDGPNEVGQYAALFDTPIIGLTGTSSQIDKVKKQYAIHSEPNPQATGHGDMITHTSSVLLFDERGQLVGTISATDNDAAAAAKLKQLVA
jgi:protein SCO1/2